MASFFKRRREGSAPPADSSISPSPSPNKWISGLVSGAGKVLSSVFGSPDGSGDEFDGDDAEMLSSDEKEDDESHKKLENLVQEREPGQVEEPKTKITMSESKVTIEQLLTKETFSREESEKLIKLIQSRVVESSSLNKQRKDVSSPNLEYTPLSPVQASPEMCSVAIAEAKKWLEEKKKSASSSTRTIDFGPCTLNTDMSQFGIESDIGSPVDLAKSYMQSKPPWQSPFLTSSSTLFNSPSPSGSRKISDNIIHGSFNHSLPSSKFLKRDYYSTGLWDPTEEFSRRVRSRLSGSTFDSIPRFTQSGSSSRLFEREILETHKNLSSVQGKEPSDADVIIPLSQADPAEGIVNISEPALGNIVVESQQVVEKEQRGTDENAVDVHEETGGIAEVVILGTSNPIAPSSGEKNVDAGKDEKILTDKQTALDGNKGAEEPQLLSDPKQHEGDLHIANSLHGSTNKNSANGLVVQSNMESEYESSTNGGPTSSAAGAGVSEDKSLNGNGTDTHGTKTRESNASPVRKGRKRVVSSRGRGRGRGRGT